MAKCIMVGCDLHDKSMLLRIAVDRGPAVTRTWGTDAKARQAMVADLRRRAAEPGAGRIVFAYEACGFGFGLHDELRAAGIECFVLAPSKMERSAVQRKRKTDEKDAQRILELLRGHVLAGNDLPSVWVPDVQTRDDREVVRQRLAVSEDAAAVQVRIRWLLKRNGVERTGGEGWTQEHWEWLEELAQKGLPSGAGATLRSLLRQLDWLWSERERVDQEVAGLSQTGRYAPVVKALCRRKGVGLLTAMVYLTEMGDPGRFENRRQVGAFLGLVPGAHESGADDDHKGHITHQGPSRVRKVLCQAVWSRVRTEPSERVAYDRIVRRNPQHKKIAVVARMRVLAVVLWHEALRAKQAAEAGKVPA